MPRAARPPRERTPFGNWQRYAFANPFAFNHCAILALTHAAGEGAEFARKLAERGRAMNARDVTPVLSVSFRNSRHVAPTPPGLPLLDGRGFTCDTARREVFAKWCELAGLRWIASVAWPTTLARFAREHRTGRYVVFVRGHVVACVEGALYGWWPMRGPLTRVRAAYQVTPIGEGGSQ